MHDRICPMSKKAFPKVIKEGHSKATIYRYDNRESTSYTVVWYEGEVRKRKVFGDLGDAELHAQARVGQLSTGTAQVLRLDGEQLLEYVRAKECVAEFGLSLDTVAAEYRDAKRLMRGRSLIDAANYFAKQKLLDVPEKTIQEVYTEMIAAKRAEGCSERYIQDLESRVGKFAKAFGTRQVLSVRGPEIKQWLQGLQHATSRTDPDAPRVPVTNRTRNNFRLCIQTFFMFARSQQYLGADWNEVEGIPLWKVKDEEVEIFTPEQLTMLLAVAQSNLVPFLAIAAFAGLRTAEIERLDWSKVDLESGYITVDAGIAKTNVRRLVPIVPCLKAWVLAHGHQVGGVPKSGKVLEVLNVYNAVKRLVTAARNVGNDKAESENRESGNTGFEWKHNALRHSFCSYRLADVKSAAQVSLEAGNSPQMIFRHYRELVTEKAAKVWFSITPEVAKAMREKIEKAQEAKIVAHPALAAA
jgi:integrase